MEVLEINGEKISHKHKPYFIAEISANHLGSIERAKKLILAAKKSGASAVKIQTYTADTMTINTNSDDFKIKNGLWKNRTLYDLYQEAHTPFEWHKELFLYAQSIGTTIFSSPFDESSVDLLESLNAPAYKIASFEIVDLPLIRYVAERKMPVIISTGLASLEEITDAVQTAKKFGSNKIALLHCLSSYPAKSDQYNLKLLVELRNKFDIQVGLSDHTTDNIAAVAAVALGATIIEKHFTLKKDEGGVDNDFSFTPEQTAKLIDDCNQAYLSLGKGDFERSSEESKNRIFRRSIYFVQDMNKGDTITKQTVRRIRPGFGLPAKYFEDILGKKVLKNVKKGDRVTMADFE